MEDLKLKKRARDDSEEPELDTDSPEVKRLRENLLAGLDDDADAEFCTPSQDLVSFMKSFEEEITASPSAAGGEADQIVDRTSESRPDLGYLLEASDDELGLPPTTSCSSGLENELRNDLVRVESESSEFGVEFWDIPSYDPFRLGLGEAEDDYSGGNGEYVVLDGLFDHSDVDFGSSEFVWRPETMPAQ